MHLDGGILQSLEQISGEAQRRFDQHFQAVHDAANVLKQNKINQNR